MINIADHTAFSGLAPNEIILGVNFSTRQGALLSSYLSNLKRGPEAVRHMFVHDIRMSIDLGAVEHAADLNLALRQFLSDYPEARRS